MVRTPANRNRRSIDRCSIVIMLSLWAMSSGLAHGQVLKEYIHLNDKAISVERSSTSLVIDTTAPVATITSPTSNTTYSTSSSSITLGGTASDNIGVTEVAWSNNRGGKGTCSGTTSWTCTGPINLQVGENVLTVTARDAARNYGSDVLTVTRTCSYSINPTYSNFGTGGGSGSVDVTTDTGCPWTADNYDYPWIGIENSSGSGSATIGYTVDYNPDANRIGVIYVNDIPFNVAQTSYCDNYILTWCMIVVGDQDFCNAMSGCQ
jgi:hypothetical protein